MDLYLELKKEFPDLNLDEVEIIKGEDVGRSKIRLSCLRCNEKVTFYWYNKNLICGKCLSIEKNFTDFKEILIKDNHLFLEGIYINAKSKIKIRCLKHNHDWFITRNAYLNKLNICSKCNHEKELKIRKKKIIDKCIKKHNNKYNYDEVDYVNSMTKVKIKCPEHGSFFQNLDCHSRGQGCVKCVMSYKEKQIKSLLEKLNIDYVYNKKLFPESSLRPDFYLPKYNLVLEYDGAQHFKPIWGLDELEKIKIRDKEKDNLCNKYNIQILRFNNSNFSSLEENLIKYVKS